MAKVSAGSWRVSSISSFPFNQICSRGAVHQCLVHHCVPVDIPTFLVRPLSSPLLDFPSPASDVWAMGVTLYQMVYGTLPFWPPSGNHHELEIMVKHRELTFPVTADAASSAAVLSPKSSARTNSGVSYGSSRSGTGGTPGWVEGSRVVGARSGGGGAMEDEDDSLEDGEGGSGVGSLVGDGCDVGKVGGAGGSMAALEAHDPMSGYLRVRSLYMDETGSCLS